MYLSVFTVQPTVGVDFLGKNIVHDSKTHRLQLWDTSGNDRYIALIPNYLKDVNCALFVYNVQGTRIMQFRYGFSNVTGEMDKIIQIALRIVSCPSCMWEQDRLAPRKP